MKILKSRSKLRKEAKNICFLLSYILLLFVNKKTNYHSSNFEVIINLDFRKKYREKKGNSLLLQICKKIQILFLEALIFADFLFLRILPFSGLCVSGLFICFILYLISLIACCSVPHLSRVKDCFLQSRQGFFV